MKNRTVVLAAVAILTVFCFAQISHSIQSPTKAVPAFDLLIKDAEVYDGSSNAPFIADVAIRGDTIAAVGKSLTGTAARVINAGGLALTPGFIDLHSHVDDGLYFPENRACLNYLTQGVTTVVVGQCGSSAWPIFEKAEDVIKRWSAEGIGPNAALLVGHGTVRQIVMGLENRQATPEELGKMKALVKEAMDEGACGLSTGLIYPPSSFGGTAEIIELVKAIAPFGGIYHSHIRNEGERFLEAVKEAIEISEKTGVRANISHLKAIGKANWGLPRQACALIEEARARGLKISADQYPYQFTSLYPYRRLIPRAVWTGGEKADRLSEEDIEKIFAGLRDSNLIELYRKVTPYVPLSVRHQQFLIGLPHQRLARLVAQSFIDPGNFEGPENARERALFLRRMADPVEAQKIRQEIKGHYERSMEPENVVIGICVEKSLEGRSLKEAAASKGKSIEDTAIELELMGAKCVPLQMGEEDIEYIMKKDYVGTGSDGDAPFFGIGLPHVRSYSTFLHKIRKYALERKAVSVAQAVRSQTSLAAQIMNWNDRGCIKAGYKADIAVIDLNNIQTPASISNAHQFSKGVNYLLINGEVMIDGGNYSGKLPGRIIKLKKA